MAVAQPDVIEEDDLTDADEKILDALAEKPLTKGAIVDRTELHRNTVGNRLDALNYGEAVDCIHERTALYELVRDPRTDESQQQAADDDPSPGLVEQLDDLREENGDLRVRLQDAHETIDQLQLERDRLEGGADVDVDALANLQDCFERGLEELPDDVPGRGSIEDCQTLLERVIGDE